MSMVEIKDLAVRLEDRFILRPFSLSLECGKTVVVSGPSGSGKSTLLKTVMGFVKPSQGEVSVEGVRLDGHSVWRVRQRMAYVPQEIDMGDGTAEEILRRLFHYRASSSLRWDEKQVKELFSEFMLGEDLLQQDVRELSGGEKQRLAFVSAILLQRPIMVLDEVTTGLDPERKRAMLEHLKRRSDITALVATHDETFMGYADEVVYLEPIASAPSGNEETD